MIAANEYEEQGALKDLPLSFALGMKCSHRLGNVADRAGVPGIKARAVRTTWSNNHVAMWSSINVNVEQHSRGVTQGYNSVVSFRLAEHSAMDKTLYIGANRDSTRTIRQ